MALNLEGFAKKLGKDLTKLKEHLNKEVPNAAGQELVNFFKRNYRKGGYVDGGFHAWEITKRQRFAQYIKGVEGKYTALHSRRNKLFSAIAYKSGNGYVTIFNNEVYADIHNDGGTITVHVTDRMRRFFWAMYYKTNGIRNGVSRKKKSIKINALAEQYKWMALTKKKSFTIKIPQRKFIYNSPEVRSIVKELVKKETIKYLNIK